MLGGSSGGGVLVNGFLQAAGLAVIVLLVRRGSLATAPAETRSLLLIVYASVAVLLATLIPLPSLLWTLFPGREPVAAGYALLGQPLPWLPISLAPTGTMATLLSFLPPVAMLLAVVVASPRGRLDAVFTLAVLAAIGVVLGIFQQLQGYNSPSYIYEITSRGGAVGFFANRNHLATLCLMTLPFLAALIAASDRDERRETRLGRQVIAGAALLFLALGTVTVQSFAGWVLLLPALAGCWLIYRRGRRRSTTAAVRVGAVLLGLAIAAALFAPSLPSLWGPEVGEMRPRERRESMTLTLDAALDYLPFGSGMGSFTQVYPAYEPPGDAKLTYVNHAHNDYLELLLEGGVFGVAFALALFAWWVRHVIPLWRSSGGVTALGRSGSVALALMFAHSVVDYPVRTAAIAAVSALAAGLMIAPDGLTAVLPPRRRRKGEVDEDNEADRTIMLGTPAARPALRSVSGRSR